MSMSKDKMTKVVDTFWWIVIFLFTMIVPTLMYIYLLRAFEQFIHYEFPLIIKILVWILLASKGLQALFGGLKNDK